MGAQDAAIPPEFADRVRRVVAATQCIPIENVQTETRLIDLGMDSHDRITLLFAVETEFDLVVPNELGVIQTVNELAAGLLRLLAERQEPEPQG